MNDPKKQEELSSELIAHDIKVQQLIELYGEEDSYILIDSMSRFIYRNLSELHRILKIVNDSKLPESNSVILDRKNIMDLKYLQQNTMLFYNLLKLLKDNLISNVIIHSSEILKDVFKDGNNLPDTVELDLANFQPLIDVSEDYLNFYKILGPEDNATGAHYTNIIREIN